MLRRRSEPLLFPGNITTNWFSLYLFKEFERPLADHFIGPVGHACLRRWAPHMDPWTLAYLAGHRDMNITKRYVHPREQNARAAMDRAREDKSGDTFGHTAESADVERMPVFAPKI